MLDAIRQFVSRRMTPAVLPSDARRAVPEVQLAACALLLELAYADSEFSPSERTHIEQALVRHFSVDQAAARELIQLAEKARASSIDHFQFTRLINEQYDLGQKMVLAELMWGVILADGTIAEHEAYLVRKLANLLNLEPGYLSAARRSAAGEAD
jgi:uncharacterized tellurite resistance protein B-like protein